MGSIERANQAITISSLPRTQTGVKEVGGMALNFTQRNIDSSFEFAEKAVRAAVMNQRPRPCSSETSRTEQGGYLRAHLTPDVAAVA